MEDYLTVVKDILQQDLQEFTEFLELVEGNSVLEIGSRVGNSLKAMAYRLPKGSRVVSVDNGFDEKFLGVAVDEVLKRNLAQLVDYELHIITGDSHALKIIDQARALGPFDTVFIDAGHDFWEVQLDWLNYGPLGKMVAFHDIQLPSVRRVWNVAKTFGENREIVYSDEMGIGVVWPSRMNS